MNAIDTRFLLLLLSFFYLVSFKTIANLRPAIQLATKYQPTTDVKQYLISEKLDGVRGYWTGEKLLTRNGNNINPPMWFIQGWPNVALDGELWLGRNKFEQTTSCVLTHKPTICWQDVRFMVFDLPDSKLAFNQRVNAIVNHVEMSNTPYLKAVVQYRVESVNQLFSDLEQVVKDGGEGLMLHHQNALYQQGRSKDIMKLKHYQDAEAVVMAHTEGKGKYQGMLGALIVKTTQGNIFKIGTGFNDKERETPPAIGSTITFRYLGKTQKGIPKFASFMRIKPAVLAK